MAVEMLLKNNEYKTIFITSNIKKQDPQKGGKKIRIEEHIKMYDNSKIAIIQRKNSGLPLIKHTGMKHLYYIYYDNDQNQQILLIVITREGFVIRILDRRRILGILIIIIII